MGVKIHIPANEVWSFFQKNKTRCSNEMVAIAQNTETEYAVYLTEEDGYPLFLVCKGDREPENDEGAISENDCTNTAKNFYLKYLFPVEVGGGKTKSVQTLDDIDDEDYDVLTTEDIEDQVYEREDELQLAMCDFLEVVLQGNGDWVDVLATYGKDVVDDILEMVLDYVASNHGLEVFRPTILEDEDGNESYTDYPYDAEIEPQPLMKIDGL